MGKLLQLRPGGQRAPGEDHLPARDEAIQIIVRKFFRFAREAEVLDRFKDRVRSRVEMTVPRRWRISGWTPEQAGAGGPGDDD